MLAFEEKKLTVSLNWNQESHNLSVGMLRICYEDVEEEVEEEELRRHIHSEKGKGYFEDLTVNLTLDPKALQFQNYQTVQKE